MITVGKRKILFLLIILAAQSAKSQDSAWIRINQMGYLPNSIKNAVLLSKHTFQFSNFSLHSALTGKTVFESRSIKEYGKYLSFSRAYRIDFSEFEDEGVYYIQAGNIQSPIFRIRKDIYHGSADYILNYMRQQRCGYNPFLQDSCHTHDGFRIYHPFNDSLNIAVAGGWHDASDYLQYVTTSANAVYQMLFAYQQNPEVFGDKYDAAGNKGSNGIPDIVDEAKWGIDWLIKMNPSKNEFYNQIADDRDHISFRLPTLDSVNYGKGLERPVYLCTGEPQGVMKYKNRTEGLASTVAKYASSFSIASEVIGEYYPDLKNELIDRAVNAYEVAKANPGVCQTAPCRAPYFYEEDNYKDDLELAAAQLFLQTNEKKFLRSSVEFGREEISTPWMGADTANHYQWYPFVNLGHYLISSSGNEYSNEFIGYIKAGIEKIISKGENNPFLNGIPFIWCSNNLVVAALTQMRLYHQITGEDSYLEYEASMRDWLFGCNPWGTSMIIGLPQWGDYPSDPHSAFWHKNEFQTWGGLVDGPVYASIFNRLIGITLYSGDEYAEFQNDYVVYHDDYGDYSTNEPTMDGTASMSFYLSAMEKIGGKEFADQNEYIHDGIVRTNKNSKNISLVFTGHEFADGGDIILYSLKKNNIKAGFFFTGDFYRTPQFEGLIEKIKAEGHYLGAHSDKHLLYCGWYKRDSTLISKDDFRNDVLNNYSEMEKYGINSEAAKYFIPPFEWYNNEISNWCEELGIKIVNFTQGTFSNADYTVPSMKNYKSSKQIYESIIDYEKRNNLNGFILLTHIGAHPERIDKFYNQLNSLVEYLLNEGYSFKQIDEAVKTE